MAFITVPSGVSTYVADASEYAGATVIINGTTYYDVNYCGDAALYYLSSRGSWEAFLIEGTIKRTDKYAQQDYYKSFDNTTIEFGRRRFLTDIKRAWELNTGWLSDDEAEAVATDIFPSTQVYLHLLDTDEILPVVITDTQAEYKTYENQNNQLVSYKINVEASQSASRNL